MKYGIRTVWKPCHSNKTSLNYPHRTATQHRKFDKHNPKHMSVYDVMIAPITSFLKFCKHALCAAVHGLPFVASPPPSHRVHQNGGQPDKTLFNRLPITYLCWAACWKEVPCIVHWLLCAPAMHSIVRPRKPVVGMSVNMHWHYLCVRIFV